MKRGLLIFLLSCTALLAGGAGSLYAQKYPERRMVRDGNKDYERGDYTASEVDYRRALEKNPLSYEAQFNLGNTLYKQERFEEAGEIFGKLGSNTERPENISNTFYNNGNALFHQQKLEEALEAYKQALRINPDDQQSKFNLAYVKKLLEKDDENNDDNKNDNNQNDQQEQPDQKDQQQDPDEDDKNDDGGQDDNRQDPPPGKDNPNEGAMSREEAEHLLDAIQQNEDKTREDMDGRKATVVGSSGKNW